jgi:hypothetical protein
MGLRAIPTILDRFFSVEDRHYSLMIFIALTTANQGVIYSGI